MRAGLSLVLCWLATASSAASAVSVDLAHRIDLEVSDVLRRTGSPSASIAVVMNDKIILTKAYGLAHIAPPVHARTSTRYGVGSISKQFTAAAILILASSGELTLDDPIARWFPELRDADKITVRQILSHTAGYQDFYAEDYTITPMRQPTTPEAIMAGWAKKPLDFPPGLAWQYSNTGYVIAGRIVEKTSGQPLFAFLQGHIFEPLHMDGVADNDAERISAPDAEGYTRAALGPVRPAIPEGRGWMYGAGELAMPAADLAKWDISIIDRTLLTPLAYAQEFKTVALKNGQDTGYALGLFVSKPKGLTLYEHSGEIAGFVSENRIYPDQKAAIVVLTNIEANGAAQMIADRIGDTILPTDPLDARVRRLFLGLQSGRLDPADLAPNLVDYFTPTTIRDFATSLQSLGRPYLFQRREDVHRGGMIHRSYRITFQRRALVLSVYVLPDGRLEQFLVGPTD